MNNRHKIENKKKMDKKKRKGINDKMGPEGLELADWVLQELYLLQGLHLLLTSRTSNGHSPPPSDPTNNTRTHPLSYSYINLKMYEASGGEEKEADLEINI